MHNLFSLLAAHSMDVTAAGLAVVGAVSLYVRHSLDDDGWRASRDRRLVMLALLTCGIGGEVGAVAIELATRLSEHI